MATSFKAPASLSLLTVALAVLNFPPAQAGDEKKPPGTIFTPPPQEAGSIPTFTGIAKKSPAGAAMDDMADNLPANLDDLLALPTLNPQQRKDLNKLRDDGRKNNAPLREELDSIKEKLRDARSNPQTQPASTASAASPASGALSGAWLPDQSPTISEWKARSAEIEKELAERNLLLWQRMKSVITVEQFEDFKKMKHGQLIPAALKEGRQ